MNIRLKLIKSQFLFSENVNLVKNKEAVLDLDKFSQADLRIISNKIRSGEVVASVSADELISRINYSPDELGVEEKSAKLVESKPHKEDHVVAEDNQEGNLNSSPEDAAEDEIVQPSRMSDNIDIDSYDEDLSDAKYSHEENIDFIKKNIIDVSTSMAIKTLQEAKDIGSHEEFFSHVKMVEESTKNRKTVLQFISKNF